MNSSRTGGNDAVAFTSGSRAAPFFAGVVHAWLAADRERPLVAAGVSMGTVAAAAMRRVYEELENKDGDDLEVKRWRWYQRYYQSVTNNPLSPLWDALPQPVDFFAETPPAKDPSVPKSLSEEAEYARRHFYLLTKSGIWLANLPVRISRIATLFVMYVRLTESYGVRFLNLFSFNWNLFITVFGLIFHLIRSPQWINESAFKVTSKRNGRRPLIGWPSYIFVWLAPVIAVVAILLMHRILSQVLYWGFYFTLCGVSFSVSHSVVKVSPFASDLSWLLLIPSLMICIALLPYRLVLAMLTSAGKPKKGKSGAAKKRSWAAVVADNLDITQGLLHPFEIKLALYNLFIKGAPDFVIKGLADDRVKALFVCAALEETDQVILRETMPLVDALTAALSIPGLLPAQRVDRRWVATRTNTHPESFQVIDGAVVRTNPLPAFFDWCKHFSESEEVRDLLVRRDGTPSLHVIYNVPTSYPGSAQDAPGMECPDIVLSAQTALQLEKRRDTRQEVRQANFLSRLEWTRQLLAPNDKAGALMIFADEIAPREPIDVGKELSPDHDKLRRNVANGCRATLETLYREDILKRGNGASIPCVSLLSSIAPRRPELTARRGGLHAVCNHCTGTLEYRPAQNPDVPQEGVLQTFGQRIAPSDKELRDMFPQLAKEEPKVVFLGSGGVFRGAFHIGVMAAMYKTNLFPDLVVGASVGTLMGGALCRMTAGNEAAAPKVLSDLVTLFVHVDEKVSLTFTLKNATKQLGIRAREIRLSPSELARKVRSGSKADAGYAVTGAPPVLNDALSSLFVIPHKNTAAITSQFVAGHFSTAVARFLREVRRETLASFDIRNCVMGVSLLENETQQLLAFSDSGAELSKVQPYQNATPSKRQVAFFGTTSFLNASCSLLLGRDFLTTDRSWNATQQGLCSSAFPAIFAPRMEADLMPGAGRTDRFFADGGMFDNLPFFPALEVLSAIQSALPFVDPHELQARVRERAVRPNLIISAGLNATPDSDENAQYNTMFAMKNRATSLSYGSKTNTFKTSLQKSLNILKEIGDKDLTALDDRQRAFLNGFVSGVVVNITPTDRDHINPTFAFCRSLGMKNERVQASIGDGCYQSLKEFSRNEHIQQNLKPNKVVNYIPRSDRSKQTTENSCPYFKLGQKHLKCPFTETPDSDAKAVYRACKNDPAHL